MWSDPAIWGPVIVAGSVIWTGSWITQSIQSASAARREDHEYLMRDLAEIASDIGRIELLVGGIANDVAPPIDPENPPY